MLVDWLDIRTALIAGALLRASEWGIERLSRSKKKRQRQPSKKKQSVIPLLLREGIRIAVVSAIVLGALAYAQRFQQPVPRHKELALRTPNLAKAMVALPYQNLHGSLPCQPKLTQPYIKKVAELTKHQQGEEFSSALRWAAAEGLVEEVNIRPTEEGGITRTIKI